MKPLRDILRNPKCKLCILHKNAQKVCLIGDGIYPADLMFVGEAPGYREDEINKPFAGRAGDLLDSVFSVLKIDRRKVFISNAVHCRPVDLTNPYMNAKPTRNQIKVCSAAYLSKEIKWVKPKLIIALGAVAAEGLLGRIVKIGQSRNSIYKTVDPIPPGIRVIITYHPAAVLRQDYLMDYLVQDLEWALKVLHEKEEKEPEVSYRLGRTKDFQRFYEAKKLSVDLETDGLDPYLPSRRVKSIQLSRTPGKATYFPWTEENKEEARILLEDPSITKVGHNFGKYDRNWLRKEGIILRGPVRDTLLQTALVDENLSPKELDVVASSFTPLKHHKEELKKHGGKSKMAEIPLDVLVRYGCGDADAALRLEKEFTPRIKKQGSWALFQLMQRAQKLFADVEWNGAKIDTALIDKVAGIYEKKKELQEHKLSEINGGEINPRSPKQLMELLYQKWELPHLGYDKKRKKKNVANTAEDTLLKLLELPLEKEQKRFLKILLRARETGTLLSRYVYGLSDHLREGDFVHPTFKLHGTVTGRLSCSDPNLQNIPREGTIKKLFISRFGRRGRLVQVDVSQAELRFAAHLSKEETLLKYFRRGDIDIHRAVAARVFKKPEKEVTERERKKTKIVNFGILYGSGAARQAAEMGVSIRDAQIFIDQWMAEFPKWGKYVDQVKKEVIEKGFVKSPFGRIRHLPILDPNSESGKEAVRQAVNSPIQGGVSDYTVHCGVEVWKRLRKFRDVLFIAEVHDSWLVDTTEDHVNEVADVFREEFEQCDLEPFYGFQLEVPMKVEVKTGINWKELELYEA